MKCRWCNDEEESQVHILEQWHAHNINLQSIMNKERTITKSQANHIAKLHNEIQEFRRKKNMKQMMQPK